MMDRIAILDVESSGLTPEDHQVIELGVVCYSIKSASVLGCYSELIRLAPERVSNEAEPVNHISTAALKHGQSADVVWSRASQVAGDCEAILAHNAEFDRQWVPGGAMPPVPWIDTCFGVDWPKQSKSGSSLISLALEHGLGVVDPHRALQDCLLLARLMTRCSELGHDVSNILERGLRPMAMFQAVVSFDEKDLAKAAGFHWDAPSRRWLRRMAVEDAENLDAGFRLRNVS